MSASTRPRRASTWATCVQLVTARRLQLAGHTPYILVGGATGMIGDPKDSGERTLNSLDTVKDWSERVRRQVEPFVSFEGAQRRDAGQQLRLDRQPVDHRLPARHRQALPGQPDAGPRRGGAPARVGHQLHRVQLRPAAVDGLPQPLPRARRDAAVRRQRPVGQHHRRRRADPARRRRQGPCVRDPADHQARRHEVRQDRGRRPVARPADDVALRLPPVVAQRRRRAGRRAAPDLHLPAAGRDRGDRGRDGREAVAARRAEAAGRRGDDVRPRCRRDRARQGGGGRALRWR